MTVSNRNRLGAIAIVGSAAMGFAGPAMSDVLYNTGNAGTATLAIGVNEAGHLNAEPNITANASATGLAYKFPDGTWQDATAPGCLCEGWGVSASTGASAASGYANVDSDDGVNNLTVNSFVADPGSITSSVSLTSLPGLRVSQVYQPATNAPGALFRVAVTITNATDGTLDNVRYVRVMDWDVPPTEFDEYVTIRGTATTTLLERSHDDGFCTADPLSGDTCGGIMAGTLDTDFIDAGPEDNGAYFRFNFGSLAAGETYSFNIFYGAAGTEDAALAAIAAEGIELFSLGQSNGGERTGSPATFIFGFSGVGGTPVVTTPEPGTLAMLGMGLLGLGAARRSKKRESRGA